MIIYTTKWLVHFYCLPLQFLTSKTVIILILEHACLSNTSQSRPTTDEALDWAYSQCCASNIYIDLTKQFSASHKEYSIIQFTEFILKHRLWWWDDCILFALVYHLVNVFHLAFVFKTSHPHAKVKGAQLEDNRRYNEERKSTSWEGLKYMENR